MSQRSKRHQDAAARQPPDILSSSDASLARPSHNPPLQSLSLSGQCLPNSLLPCNCPSASSNECQSCFSAGAGFSTAVTALIMEGDGRYWGSFPMRWGQPQYPSCSPFQSAVALSSEFFVLSPPPLFSLNTERLSRANAFKKYSSPGWKCFNSIKDSPASRTIIDWRQKTADEELYCTFIKYR